MSVETPDELIARYREAFLRANGKPLGDAMSVTYERGWFVVRDEWGTWRYRRLKVEAMIARLACHPFPPSTAESGVGE